MNSSKILYIGGFEMPDKNAAAQRVLSIAKSLRESGYDTKFYGITHSNDVEGTIDGFKYEALIYPDNKMKWLRYLLGMDIIDYIKKEHPSIIITYNYPALAQEKVIRFCRKHGIVTIGDITEWYRPRDIIKDLDTSLRMKWSNRHLDGIIAISTYLAKYYSDCKVVQLPPFVDKTEAKWVNNENGYSDDKIHLVYIGTGSVKDRLDKVLGGIESVAPERFAIDVIGIDLQKYHQIYINSTVNLDALTVTFHGKLPHLTALSYLKKSDFQIFFRDNIRVNNAGFPTKFVESMSAGIPVITNKISNIDDYIIDGVNSFMIEDNSDDKIISIIQKVANLTANQILEIKKNCLVNDFHYSKYSKVLGDFVNSL